jgi:uncharacterized protein (DUF58 family)
MIPQEVFQKIRRIQILSSHNVDELLAGSWHSAFKGRGIEFEEVRPYQIGDDVRSIDWNVTARNSQPFVKLFREKRELVAELGATLAFSAIKNNDKVGLTLFTDAVEKSIPPRKGSRHVLRMIRELLYCQPLGKGTSIRGAIEHLNRVSHRRSLVFLISDFQDQGYEPALRIARRKHDIIPIVIQDRHETQLPNVGLIRLRDAETGVEVVVDTASRRNRRRFSQVQQQWADNRRALFRRLQLDSIELFTGDDPVEPLRRYFHQRELRR